MRVLVADDSEVILSLVGLVAEHQDLEFIPARSGTEALLLFQQTDPDVVLTDFEMPGLNGLELCREIKRVIGGKRFVPIVMMTASSERAVRDQALQLGVIEFLEKPLLPGELSCRLNTLSELARLHQGLERYKEESEQEMSLAKHILGRVVQREMERIPSHLHMETLTTQRANGDLCVYRRTLTGHDRGMICDATGHGLASGICTLPLAETFLSMAPQAFRLESIFLEGNAKLLARLPVDRFVCTLMYELDTLEMKFSVLNAGLPDAFLLRKDGSFRAFPSMLPPAGIFPFELKDIPLEVTRVEPGDRFLAFTDGLSDLMAENTIVGNLLRPGLTLGLEDHVALISAALHPLTDDLEAADDISWVLLDIPAVPALPAVPIPSVGATEPPLETGFFQLSCQINPKLLSPSDLAPRIIRYLQDQGMAELQCNTLSLALAEAITNAVDHGILGLDSVIKTEGFEAYEVARQARFDSLEAGEVGLSIQLNGTGHSKDLRVTSAEVKVWDSGTGFDWKNACGKGAEGNQAPCGRGLVIINAISSQVVFTPPGNQICFRIDFE